MTDVVEATTDVNVERPDDRGTPESTVRSGKPRWLLPLVAIIAAAAVVAGILVVRGLPTEPRSTTPEYALQQLASAARSGDWNGVKTYVDVEAVAGHFVDVTLASAAGEESTGSAGSGVSTATSGAGGMGGGANRAKRGPSMKESFVKGAVDALESVVKDGTIDADAGGLQSVLLAGKATSTSYPSETEASVTMEIPGTAGETEVVTLTMIKSGDTWKVTALDGVSSLLGSTE